MNELGKNLYFKTVRKGHLGRQKRILYEKRHRCAIKWCRVTDYRDLTVDHIMPVSVAFASNWNVTRVMSIKNLQLLCSRHHSDKDSYHNIKAAKLAAVYKYHVVLSLHNKERLPSGVDL